AVGRVSAAPGRHTRNARAGARRRRSERARASRLEPRSDHAGQRHEPLRILIAFDLRARGHRHLYRDRLEAVGEGLLFDPGALDLALGHLQVAQLEGNNVAAYRYWRAVIYGVREYLMIPI